MDVMSVNLSSKNVLIKNNSRCESYTNRHHFHRHGLHLHDL